MRWIRRLFRASFGLVEQVLMSAASLITTLLAARYLDAAEFSATGLSMALYFAVGGIHRNVIVIPFVIHFGGKGGVSAIERGWDIVCFVLAAALAIGAALAGAAASFVPLVPHWVVQGLLAASISLAPTLLYDFARRKLLGADRLPILLLSSTLFCIAQLGLVAAVLMASLTRSALGVAAAMAAAAGLAWLASERATSALATGSVEPWWTLLGRLIKSTRLNVIGHLAFMAYTQLTILMMGVSVSATGVALLVASRSLINPVATIVTAVDNTQAFRVAQAYSTGGLRALRRGIRRQIALQAGIALPYFVCLLVFAQPLVTHLLGPRYAAATPLLWWWLFPYTLVLANLPLDNALQTLGRGRALLVSRLGAALFGTTAILCLSRAVGVHGAIIGSGVGILISTAISLLTLFSVRRSG